MESKLEIGVPNPLGFYSPSPKAGNSMRSSTVTRSEAAQFSACNVEEQSVAIDDDDSGSVSKPIESQQQ